MATSRRVSNDRNFKVVPNQCYFGAVFIYRVRPAGQPGFSRRFRVCLDDMIPPKVQYFHQRVDRRAWAAVIAAHAYSLPQRATSALSVSCEGTGYRMEGDRVDENSRGRSLSYWRKRNYESYQSVVFDW
ncbi:hypothetical protein EVAR_66965_1 [Eumeta japonica]|uniref:Uncharacterized protein n=1 Tax=Eumeta variegata TaxID=151549 RepID=A0A4C1ZYN5_EUMVA|nr:hypothetical protein EVAR_66965_1 [Eumeta japonica]